MKDLTDTIKDMGGDQLKKLIRKRLEFDQHEIGQLRIMEEGYLPHRRFDMSGYGDGCGSCVIHNQNILNLFRDCGIYNFVHYLHVDAYKGVITVRFSPWSMEEEHHAYDFGGLGTVDIIREIIYLTVQEPLRDNNNPSIKRRVD